MRTIGRFIVRELLGSGTEGEVYRCRDPMLQREVAIKVLHGRLLHGRGIDPLHEARTLGGLSHPNLVAVFDAGELDGRPYLVFELVEGRTLADLLRDGALEPARVLSLLDGMLAAVAHAHAHGVVHRDLKPANVIVTGEGVPKVTDFGIAALLGDGRGPDQRLVGTPRYMAPEYIEEGRVSRRSDVYALGLIAYEMLAGRPAYPGGDLQALLREILGRSPEPLQRVVSGLDPGLRRLIERALHRQPEARFADAGQMRKALQSLSGAMRGDMAGGHSTVAFLLRRMRLKQDFPALARSVSTINRLAGERHADSRRLAEVIVRDQGLSSKILRVVNSAYYAAFSGQISTISRAVVVLGINGVRSIVSSLSLLEHFVGKVETETLRDRLSASLYSGLCARELGRLVDPQLAEEAMLGAMLRGLGGILVTYYLPDEAQAIARLAAVDGVTAAQAQRQVLGTDFLQIGQAVAREWRFPEEILGCLEAVPPLPEVSPVEPGQRLPLITGLADRITTILQRGRSAAALADLKALVVRHAVALGVEPTQISGAIHVARQAYMEFEAGFADRSQRRRFIERLGEDDTGGPAVVTGSAGGNAANTVVLDTACFERPPAAPSPDPRQILDEAVERLACWEGVGQDGRGPSLAAMEALRRALGLRRLVTARWDETNGTLRGLAGVGDGGEALARRFEVRCVGGLNLLSVALIRNSDVYIADATRASVRDRLPGWLGGAGSILILPMRAEAGPVGMLYAEYGLSHGFDGNAEILRRVKTLRDGLCRILQGGAQLVMAR